MRILEGDLVILEGWLKLLNEPNGEVDTNDNNYDRDAVNRCLGLLLSSGCVAEAAIHRPGVYVSVYEPNSALVPTIEYYRDMLRKQMKEQNIVLIKDKKLKREKNIALVALAISVLSLIVSLCVAVFK